MRSLLVVLTLEKAEQAPLVVLKLVEAVVDMGADPPDRTPVAPGEEVLGLGMLEEGVARRLEPISHIEQERRDPARLVAVEVERK